MDLRVEREPVQSSVLASVGFDAQQQVLEIEFRTGRIYRYRGVSAELHAWLMRSPNKGALFNRLVDGKFEFERVDPIDPEAPSLEDALRASLAAASKGDGEAED